ncbi:division/cell wall cluster transcriptional repressor MraZ [Desulfolithobacter sp.]
MNRDRVGELRFRSRSEHTLDAKGRLNIPSRFREVLREVYDETLIVTNWQKSLKAYPVPEWEILEEKLLTEGRMQPGFGDFVRYVISGVTECPLDKQGRILIPGSLRTEFGIGKEVVLNGMLDHFEIWDKTAWQNETRRTRENFQNFEQGLSSLGIL